MPDRYAHRIVGEPGTQMTAQTVLLVVGVLIGVLALIGVAAKLYQFTGWRAQPRPGRTLILRESIALDPRRRIHLVQCGQRQVVLLTGGGQDLVIGWMQDP
jgi:flagellar protein FliO/FliZ